MSRFLLPLASGGDLHVGRPLGPRALAQMVAASRSARRRGGAPFEPREQEAMTQLARIRAARAHALVFGATAPPLDEATLRLGVAVHNLLVLGHPRLRGRAAGRVAVATLPIAELGPPTSADEAVRRHSLLARIGEITRSETVVEFWAGSRRFVGRTPPPRLFSFPELRRVRATTQRRSWFKEVGVPACGREVWMALCRASPLGEALDPLRLDPPLAWERILPVLRFPSLCRVVAGRLLELGIEPAGAAIVAALLRFASLRDTGGPPATPEAVAFGIRFLAHGFWLHHLYAPAAAPVAGASDLAALLVAAREVDERLVLPPDVAAGSEMGARFGAQIDGMRPQVLALTGERHALALTLCRFAANRTAFSP